MTQRDWIEKDFYRELGVASGASQDEIKKAYRKLARELHPDANPGDAQAEARFKSVSEAYGVLSDEKKRREYDETRALFAGGGGARASPAGSRAAQAASPAARQTFDMGDLFGNAGGAGPGLGDLLGGIFGGAGGRGTRASATRGQRGADVESELRIDFTQAVTGAEVPIRLSAPGRCQTCSRHRCPAGHRPAAVPDVLRTRPGQPQPGRVRVLRAVPGLPRHRPDHRRPVPRVRRRRRQHPDPLAHHPRSRGGGRRAADQARRPGRAGPRRRPRGRPVRQGARHAAPGVRAVEGQPGRPRGHGSRDLPGAGARQHDRRADAGRLGHPADPGGDPERARRFGCAGAACRSAPARRATCSSRSTWPCRSAWTTPRRRRCTTSPRRPRASTRGRTSSAARGGDGSWSPVTFSADCRREL